MKYNHIDVYLKVFQKVFLEVHILYAVFCVLNMHYLTSGHLINIQSALTYFQSGSASG